MALSLDVKAGKYGTLSSLGLFMQEYSSPLGLRVSQLNQSFTDGLLSVPLYAILGLNGMLKTLVGAGS